MTSKMRKAAGIKSKSECVKVIVRVRPLSHKEKANGNEEVAKIDINSKNQRSRICKKNSIERGRRYWKIFEC